MERKLKPIPIGNPNFREIIENGNLYIDKTKYIYNLISNKSVDNIFFLSRPRRFGKSLTIDTLEQIFIGNKELFKGLYIYDEYDFEEYPVIRLNMSLTPFSDLKGLLSNLYKLQIRKIAEKYMVDDLDENDSPAVWLDSLLSCFYYGCTSIIHINQFEIPIEFKFPAIG